MRRTILLFAWGLLGCSQGMTTPVDGGADAAPPMGDPFDVPIDGLDAQQLKIFFDGDDLFGVPLRDADGLGPLYIRTSCGGCHAEGIRGPGSVQKMSVVLQDGITTSPDQSKLPYGHTVHPLYTAGAKTPITAPNDPSVKVTIRVGPPILGRGYIEAIMDSEIQRVAAEQAKRTDAIHGKINHVIYTSEMSADTRFHTLKKGDMAIGRFGLKARIATIDDFTGDAAQGDMGITSPLRPNEIPNPDMLSDDLKPGVDITLDSLNLRANYMRLTAIPKRDITDQGRALFDQAKCSACHVPSMKTRADYPIKVIANIDAVVYTDVLIHDMGDALADGMTDGEATSRYWRTAPLIGLRFNSTFMHDGRANSIDKAILAHEGNGSEANESVMIFKGLAQPQRDALLEFVGAL